MDSAVKYFQRIQVRERIFARIPTSYWLVTTLFCFAYISYYARSGVIYPTFSFKDFLVFFSSLVGLFFLWFILGTLLSVGRRSYLAVFSLFLFFYYLFGTYHFHAKIPFDITVALDNCTEALNWEAIGVVLDSISFPVFAIGLLPIAAGLAVPWLRRRIMAERAAWSKRRYAAAAGALFLYTGITFSPYPQHDELGLFFHSLYDYVRRDSLYQLDDKPDPNRYSYIVNEKKPLLGWPVTTSKRSSIILLQIESFNQSVVGKVSPDGIPYTPFLSEKLKEGLYIERFYANSIQSSKGQFSTLFSLIPSFKQKVFTSYTGTRFQSLPQVLKECGYATMFFKAYRDVNYDNTGRFLCRNGVQKSMTIVPLLSDDEKKHRSWGWGIEDEVFYRHFFEYLDSQEDIVSGKRPVFAMLHTVMNHMYFNKVPRKKRKVFPDATRMEEHYANSIRLTDDQLQVFFEEAARRPYLKDAILIVTGDHSYPISIHGYTHNEASWYEEFFRTPFLLIAPGRFAPVQIRDKAYSQMDIAPTLLELLGIKPERHHFRGVSMFAEAPQHTIYLIQPYNGIFLGVIHDGWWKYVRHLRTNQEFIYDLRTDPGEKKNLITTADPYLVKHLQGTLQNIYLNQRLIEKDRVWDQPLQAEE